MKDKFEMGDGGVAEVEMPVEERADKPPFGGDAAPDLVQGLEPKTEKASQTLKQLQPQTPAQEEKKGFLLRVKSFFGGKELSPVEKIDKQLDEDIRALTHITTSNPGMGGLAVFTSGGFKGIGEIIKRYGLSEDEVSKVCKMEDEVENMNQGPEKVAMRKQLNTLKSAVTAQMYAVAERMKSNL